MEQRQASEEAEMGLLKYSKETLRSKGQRERSGSEDKRGAGDES